MQRFSRHVLDCIIYGDYAISNSFMGGRFIVNKDRMDRSKYPWADSPKDDTEWSLTLTSWIFGLFPRVWLNRGNHNKLKLTRIEHRALALACIAVEQKLKYEMKEAKRQRKLEHQRAAFIDSLDTLKISC